MFKPNIHVLEVNLYILSTSIYSEARETLDLKCNPCVLCQREVCTIL